MESQLASLLESLASPDGSVRRAAILELGKLRNPQSISTLVNVLVNDPDLNVHEDATWALTQIGETSVPELLAALPDATPQARHNLVHALGKIGAWSATSALIAATKDADDTVRNKAVFALGQLGNPQAIPALINALADPVQNVQWGARAALENFGLKALPALISAQKSDDPAIRELAASLMGNIDDNAVLAPLMQATTDPAWEVRLAAIEGLAYLGNPKARSALTARLNDEHPHAAQWPSRC